MIVIVIEKEIDYDHENIMNKQTSQFYPAPLPVPERLETAVFTLTPLTPAHAELDLAALMVSKPMLRLWSGSSWPTDDFTLEENIADLEWHFSEHQERIAFTYTVLTPDETECLGCIYIKAVQSILPADSTLSNNFTNLSASTRFWIKEPRLTDGLDMQLLQTLQEWFDNAWQFDNHTFHTRAAHKQQVQLLENCDLSRQLTLDFPNRGGVFYFYG
ncbi:MAG: hypothetical protein DWQ04_18295 [Chloroflexi bacterium]|nr:MAG: hypothetical protein DWQ04_18295 [Chloroflexota bacterium]